jgi:ParB family transcriptional regulator, chromosome partitioning protein
MSQSKHPQSVPHRRHHDHRRRPHPNPGARPQPQTHNPTPNAQHPNPTPNTQHPTPVPHVRLIPWEQIVPNPNQPRKHYDEQALQELADSIRQHGILQPLLVLQRGNERFELVAGERRHRAAKIAGVTLIPVIIQQLTDQQQAEISLIENLQREDLSPVETARAFQTLMHEFGMTQTGIARRIGKSQSAISHLLRLLQLPEEILEALNRGELQEGHAQALLKIEDTELRERLCQKVIAERLSVREIRHLLRETTEAKEEPTPTTSSAEASLSIEEDTLEAQLTQKLGRKVTIRHSPSGEGEFAIGFANVTDMRHLSTILLKTSE